MSHYMTALAMKQKGLKPATKIVLYWLADHHNGETGRCFPSLARLSEVCEMSKRSVQNQINALETAGLISISHNYREDGQQTANNFSFHMQDAEGWQNLLGGVAKSAQGGWQNLPANNLGRYNLGNKQDDILAKLGFDDFWQVYPIKVKKEAARRAWAKAVKLAPPDSIIAGAIAYAEVRQGQDKQYTAHPASWLNDGRWQDDFNALKASKDKAHGKRDGEAAERARRAGERWAARAVDFGQDRDASGPLFSAGQPLRIAGGSD